MAKCGCHCIRCGGTDLGSRRVGEAGPDGYADMHHTCNGCGAHFDHLDGETFGSCAACGLGPGGEKGGGA